MKMDLRWDYNNVRIKEEDEWKVAFTILEESFELMVMFIVKFTGHILGYDE